MDITTDICVVGVEPGGSHPGPADAAFGRPGHGPGPHPLLRARVPRRDPPARRHDPARPSRGARRGTRARRVRARPVPAGRERAPADGHRLRHPSTALRLPAQPAPTAPADRAVRGLLPVPGVHLPGGLRHPGTRTGGGAVTGVVCGRGDDRRRITAPVTVAADGRYSRTHAAGGHRTAPAGRLRPRHPVVQGFGRGQDGPLGAGAPHRRDTGAHLRLVPRLRADRMDPAPQRVPAAGRGGSRVAALTDRARGARLRRAGPRPGEDAQRPDPARRLLRLRGPVGGRRAGPGRGQRAHPQSDRGAGDQPRPAGRRAASPGPDGRPGQR